ncbi:MAG: hypothetical protein QOI77_3182 [Blastocatellia bacterium]|nr:hypothetical protein [Blastocatellia bacterium]
MMNGKECHATRREIDEAELNQQLSNQARAHVALCAACRDFRAERTSLRELVGSLEPVTAPGDFDLRLRARLARERQGNFRQPWIFGLVIGTPAITVAALVVIMGLALVWLARRNTSQTPEIARVPVKEVPVTPQQPALAVNQGETGQSSIDIAGPHKAVNVSRNIGRPTSADIKAVDYGVSNAESIQQIEQRAGEVSLRAPLKPMVVSMEDDRGATHRISLPPVSFGAQRMADRTPASFTSNSRSW